MTATEQTAKSGYMDAREHTTLELIGRRIYISSGKEASDLRKLLLSDGVCQWT